MANLCGAGLVLASIDIPTSPYENTFSGYRGVGIILSVGAVALYVKHSDTRMLFNLAGSKVALKLLYLMREVR